MIMFVNFLTSDEQRPLNLQRFLLSIHTATTAIYTLSLHDALPIYRQPASSFRERSFHADYTAQASDLGRLGCVIDRKSTRLNSSHLGISYAVFCLKKKICLVVVGGTSVIAGV